MARRPAAEAPNFKKRGAAKLFITKAGGAYLLLGFADGSALVLRMIRGTKNASADFKPVPGRTQKDVLIKRLRAKGQRSSTTYELAWSLLT